MEISWNTVPVLILESETIVISDHGKLVYYSTSCIFSLRMLLDFVLSIVLVKPISLLTHLLRRGSWSKRISCLDFLIHSLSSLNIKLTFWGWSFSFGFNFGGVLCHCAHLLLCGCSIINHS